jgi:tRNA1Val (adenine37-N6)-methyltransferase
MKVGTDAVLLGAWADAPDVKRVLDVGCGSGVIALMLAQRFPQSHVVGVELDADAALQARENVTASPWADRLEVLEEDFCTYHAAACFDLIVSNPPYFIDALRPPVEERSMARHAAGLNYETLFRRSRELLAANGRVCVILPAEVETVAVDAAARNGLYVERMVRVFTKEGKPLRRVLLSFATTPSPVETTNFYLMNADGSYTDAYWGLTADFYLKW